ncbi:solute symporter family protein [Pseudonocardia sp. TRM90224]|uniref:solute symporter family protein n=1 Tax=Pseudonocardia sp. TRM90224 TaxID=2812678 RepID=UPI001E654A3B|nr:cation acetate symporter [Pseudonocardia sp. TRM90224]
MMVALTQQAPADVLANVAAIGASAVVILVVVLRSRRPERGAAEFFTAGRGFTATQNGMALTGGYLSAATFLGVAGAIAVYGYDGLLLAVAALVAWLVALLLVGEWTRNTGRTTLGDVIAFRLRDRAVRKAVAAATLLITILLLVVQIAAVGGMASLLLGIGSDNRFLQSVVIACVGAVVIGCVLAGGMRGITWVQILKANLLVVTGAVLAAWVLGRYGFDGSALLGAAVANSPHAGEQLLAPGLQFGSGALAKLDFLSLAIAAVLGPASMPHVVMRFYTVADGPTARRSVAWAIWLVGTFLLLVIVIGFGAAALVGAQTVLAAPGASNSAVPLLAHRLGGAPLLGLVAAAVFTTVLGVATGMLIAAATSFSRDLYGTRRNHAELGVARVAVVVVGVVATAGAVLVNGQNVAVLLALALAVAASANLPSLVYALFWREFNTTGALCGIYGGTALSLLLVVFSPAATGTPSSMLPGLDIAVFPLANPGLVAIPAAFLLAAVGTWVGQRDDMAKRRFAEMEVRAVTGAEPPDDDEPEPDR